VQAYIDTLETRHGFDPQELNRIFYQTRKREDVLKAIARPAEKELKWFEYRRLFMDKRRIRDGIRFLQRYRPELQRAQREYGIPPEIIVAILGVETRYGQVQGRYRIMDALTTLGFDYPPRSRFFRNQLTEFLLMAREQGYDPLDIKGSYAGAMGYPQFMPSSFRHYAADFDGDGRIDLWKDPLDAIGSIANYFKHHGWAQGQFVVSQATVTGERYQEGLQRKLKPEHTVLELTALGWQPNLALRPGQPARGIKLDGEQGTEYWVTLQNFYVITRYNHSTLYAMAVYELSEALRQGYQQKVEG
jgi:membrane-bound lytic murein transglycosylase B